MESTSQPVLDLFSTSQFRIDLLFIGQNFIGPWPLFPPFPFGFRHNIEDSCSIVRFNHLDIIRENIPSGAGVKPVFYASQ